MDPKTTNPDKKEWAKGVARILAFSVVAAALVWASMCEPIRQFFALEHIRHVTDSLGPFGPLAIVAFGLVTPLLFIPRWPLAVVSGLLYGVMWGVLLSTFASTLGALLQFYLARTLLAHTASRLIARSRLANVSIPRPRAFIAIFMLRAFPFSNFVVTNLLAGALRLPLRSYLFGSFLGMIPSSYMYAACGKFMKQPSLRFLLSAFACVALITVGTVLSHRHWSRWLGFGGGQPPET